MDSLLRDRLLEIAKKRIRPDDPSHDIHHAMRVLANAEWLAEGTDADMDILVPAALFHGLVVYPKHLARSRREQDESAAKAGRLLQKMKGYPKAKIPMVQHCIRICSFAKNIDPDTIEAKIPQDADKLESTGAISIMRTFCSTGQMKRQFYDQTDPFTEKRAPDSKRFALDLFPARLLQVEKRLHTKRAKTIAAKRHRFLKAFLAELRHELPQTMRK